MRDIRHSSLLERSTPIRNYIQRDDGLTLLLPFLPPGCHLFAHSCAISSNHHGLLIYLITDIISHLLVEMKRHCGCIYACGLLVNFLAMVICATGFPSRGLTPQRTVWLRWYRIGRAGWLVSSYFSTLNNRPTYFLK